MRHQTPTSLLEFLGNRPPFLVFYVGRSGKGRSSRPTPFTEKLERSGLSLHTFKRMSQSLDWSEFSAGNIDAFARGCGVDLFHFKDHRKYISRTIRSGTGLLRTLNPSQKRRFTTLCQQWLNHQQQAQSQPRQQAPAGQ